jgi:hypothetical protein
VFDLSRIAPNLQLRGDGIWYSPRGGAVDYPDAANAFCFQVEEGSFWFRHRNAVILEVVRRFPPAGWIADIGAGNGFVSMALQQHGVETVIIEPGESGVRNAQRRRIGPLVCATLEEAGFEPRSLPAAGLFDVLEHVEDDEGFLRRVNGLLAADGRLYVSVPAFQALWSAEDQLTGHHRRYTIAGLEARLEKAGFTVEYATYLFASLALPVCILRAAPWRLGLRGTIDAQRTRRELQQSGALSRIISRLLDRELAAIRRGRTLSFGSSCLIVARKRQ